MKGRSLNVVPVVRKADLRPSVHAHEIFFDEAQKPKRTLHQRLKKLTQRLSRAAKPLWKAGTSTDWQLEDKFGTRHGVLIDLHKIAPEARYLLVYLWQPPTK